MAPSGQYSVLQNITPLLRSRSSVTLSPCSTFAYFNHAWKTYALSILLQTTEEVWFVRFVHKVILSSQYTHTLTDVSIHTYRYIYLHTYMYIYIYTYFTRLWLLKIFPRVWFLKIFRGLWLLKIFPGICF